MKPVIRWIKGNGQDDHITRAAISHATRLFGDQVEFYLDVNGITHERVARVLEWARQPVRVYYQQPSDNPELANLLCKSGCSKEKFGYWWKWFPARHRLSAPEIVLDGDIVVVKRPPWFGDWLNGSTKIYVTNDPNCGAYGQYKRLVDERKLYSGLLAFPPFFDFNAKLLGVLRNQPLALGHDGTKDVSEQGCVAAAFKGVDVDLIPLSELPFAKAIASTIDYGPNGRVGEPWGFHFSRTFIKENEHFTNLIEQGIIDNKFDSSILEKYSFLVEDEVDLLVTRLVLQALDSFCGRSVLVVNPKKGYLAAVLSAHGCKVTAMCTSRNIAENLTQMGVRIINGGTGGDRYACIIMDKCITADDFPDLWRDMSRSIRSSGRLFVPVVAGTKWEELRVPGMKLRHLSVEPREPIDDGHGPFHLVIAKHTDEVAL